MQHKDSSKITFRSKFFNKEGDGHKRIELYIYQKEENFKNIKIDESLKLYSQ